MNAIKKTMALLAFCVAALHIGLAQSADEIIKQVSANLNKSPWEATLAGTIQNDAGAVQEAEIRVQVLPGTDRLTRLEFKKPSALEGNWVLISDKEVWNYLFLTNQLIIQNRATAKLAGLNDNIIQLGDFDKISERVTLKLVGEENTPQGAAWKLSGVPKTAGQGFSTMEILILKSDPRPVNLTVKDAGGKPLANLTFKDFKRSDLSAKGLKKYPADAAVVRK